MDKISFQIKFSIQFSWMGLKLKKKNFKKEQNKEYFKVAEVACFKGHINIWKILIRTLNSLWERRNWKITLPDTTVWIAS